MKEVRFSFDSLNDQYTKKMSSGVWHHVTILQEPAAYIFRVEETLL